MGLFGKTIADFEGKKPFSKVDSTSTGRNVYFVRAEKGGGGFGEGYVRTVERNAIGKIIGNVNCPDVPSSALGKVDIITEIWLKWAEENGYIDG